MSEKCNRACWNCWYDEFCDWHPAEYSAYEHERKPFDPEVYKKCKAYLSHILERGDGG